MSKSMTTVGRFTSVPSLSGFSMFETPRNADIVPSGFSFLRNDEPSGHTKDEARDSELFYNQQRRHSSFGYLSPANFERLHLEQAAVSLGV